MVANDIQPPLRKTMTYVFNVHVSRLGVFRAHGDYYGTQQVRTTQVRSPGFATNRLLSAIESPTAIRIFSGVAGIGSENVPGCPFSCRAYHNAFLIAK